MMRRAHSGVRRAACLLALLAAPLAAVCLRAQSELLPLDHPATWTLVRVHERGGIPDFPREHLPIGRGAALAFLRLAAADLSLPAALREQAAYYRDELSADDGVVATAVFIPTSDASTLVYDRPFAGLPIAIAEGRDTALGAHVVLEPVLDAELRTDPDASGSALIAQGGVQFRGTAMKRLGFSARVTNGSVAGDSLIALRDPRVRCNGSFGITGYGRDLSFSDGHLRADFGAVTAEIGREKVQLGGGLGASLLLGSDLPCNTDYLRFGARVGRFAFTHVHAALLPETGADDQGPFADIPAKYIAAHLLTVGPFAGMRLSIGESVIYQGRGFELGYLNPFVFMKMQEQYLRDRDNANLYLAMSAAPLDGLLLEGELMIDDLRFSLIGDSRWNNKTAWRVAARSSALIAPWLDASVAYTRLEPYVFTHFNELSNYTHGGMLLAGGELQPNSYMVDLNLTAVPAPNLRVHLAAGSGEHGANVMGLDSAGAETLVFNAGGDVRRTHRAIIDADTVTFLGGTLETLTRLRLEVEYEPLRNVYLRLIALRNTIAVAGVSSPVTELRFGLRVGAH